MGPARVRRAIRSHALRDVAARAMRAGKAPMTTSAEVAVRRASTAPCRGAAASEDRAFRRGAAALAIARVAAKGTCAWMERILKRAAPTVECARIVA